LTYDQENKLRSAVGPFPPKEKQDIPAPLVPPFASSIQESVNIPGISNILLYPNPAKKQGYLDYSLAEQMPLSFGLQRIDGLNIKHWDTKILRPGKHQLKLDFRNIPAGLYIFKIQCKTQSKSFKLVVIE
jgi:hypothetical protein